ncbi:hypothetical protein CRX72_07840 [Pantoea sp. BRM17]|nr:hypothetical protein CRX72_07840 [Pantoea sp. BRM17]
MALLSIVLFLTAIIIYACKAGRNTFWFSLMLLLLTLFIVLNATLFASNSKGDWSFAHGEAQYLTGAL